MHGRLGITLTAAIVVCTLLAVTAPAAFATTWDITKPYGSVVGHVRTTNSPTFRVTNKAGDVVGKVIKTGSGGWKVVRGSKRIAAAKADGNAKYPANLYDLKGTRIGRCKRSSGAWELGRINNIFLEIRALAPRDCPARAALGATRLLNWK